MKNEHLVWAYAELEGGGYGVMIGLTDEGITWLKENPQKTLLANPPGDGFANVKQIMIFHEKDKASLKELLRKAGVPVSEVN